MDFFKELLESFSRVHDRSLRLLEMAARSSEADALIATANSQKSPMWQPAVTKNPSGKDVGVFITRDGVPKGGYLGGDGLVLGGSNQYDLSNAEGLNKFYGLFSEDEGGDTDEGTTERVSQAVPAGETVRQGAFETEAAREDASTAFDRMGRLLPEALENAGLDPSKYGRLFVGATNESFEKKLSESNKFLIYNEEFEGYEFVEGVLSDETIVGVAETMENMLEALSKGKCPTRGGPNEQTFTDNITKTKRGEIVITPEGGDISQGLVFTDDTRGRRKNLGTMKEVINKAFELCGEKIPEIDVLDAIGEGGKSDNQTIGTGFEMFQKLAALSISINRLKSENTAIPKDLKAEFELTKEKFTKKMEGLSMSTAKAFAMQKKVGLTPEDSAVLNELKDLFGVPKGQTTSLFINMAKMSMVIINDRNPKFVTEAGGETKFGNRQDIREYHSNEGEAEAALTKAGLDPEDYVMKTLQEMIEEGHMSKREAKAALAVGLATDLKTPIAVLKTSLKFYKDLNHVTLGGGSNNTYNQMMEEGLEGSPHSKLINTMLADLIGKNKDGSTETPEAVWESMQKYAKDLRVIEDTINEIPSKAKVITDSGTTERLYVNSSERFADAVAESFTNNSNYKELSTGAKKKIMSRIKLLKNSRANYTADALFNTIQHEVTTMLTYAKVEKDLNTDLRENEKKEERDTRVKNAQRWLASKAYHAGGSDDSKLNETAVSRETGDSYVYNRNKLLRKVVNGKGGWGIDTKKSKFEDGLVIYSGKKGASVTLSTNTVPTRSKKDGETVAERKSVNSKTTLSLNGPAQAGEDNQPNKRKVSQTSSTILQALGSLYEALGIIKEKVRLLNT
jgi:hypothetical protein